MDVNEAAMVAAKPAEQLSKDLVAAMRTLTEALAPAPVSDRVTYRSHIAALREELLKRRRQAEAAETVAETGKSL